jgi:hypothetical protein
MPVVLRHRDGIVHNNPGGMVDLHLCHLWMVLRIVVNLEKAL